MTDADVTAPAEPAEPEPATGSATSNTESVTTDGPETTADRPAPVSEIDLDAMAADLDGVDAALVRLADGTYWTDEVTGQPLPVELLEADPLARRA